MVSFLCFDRRRLMTHPLYMIVFRVLAVSLWITELKKKLRLRVLAGSEVEENLISESWAFSRKVLFGLYWAVSMWLMFFASQRRRMTSNKKLPSWIQLVKPKLHSVCRPHSAILAICLKLFVWILNMQWCLSTLVLTLVKLQNELKTLQDLIYLTDNQKRLSGEDVWLSQMCVFPRMSICCSLLLSVCMQSCRICWRQREMN